MSAWYTTNQLYDKFGLKIPDFTNRNLFLYLSDREFFAMPQNVNIGLNIKKDGDFCLAVPVSNTITIYQFNQKSLYIFEDFAKKFPNAFARILQGEIISQSNQEINSNQYVTELSDEDVNAIVDWNKTIKTKAVSHLERSEPNKLSKTVVNKTFLPEIKQKKPFEKSDKHVRQVRQLTLGDFMKTYVKPKKPVPQPIVHMKPVQDVVNPNAPLSKPKKKKLTKMKKGILKDRETKVLEMEMKKEMVNEDGVDHEEGELEDVQVEDYQKGEHVVALKEETAIVDEIRSNGAREYVEQELSPELDVMVTEVLAKLYKFQKTLKQMNPRNYKARKRVVFGLREVLRAWKQRLLKSIIIAPNIQKGDSLDSVLYEILDAAHGKIPIIYALNMKKIGKALGKSIKISIVGVLSADGAMDEYRKMLGAAKQQREEYLKNHPRPVPQQVEEKVEVLDPPQGVEEKVE